MQLKRALQANEQYVYGLHAVQALLVRKQRKVHILYICKDRRNFKTFVQPLVNLALELQIAIEELNYATMQQWFTFTHQGIVAIAETPPIYNEGDLSVLLQNSKQPSLLLILDGITDPHNLGACLRTADATGVDFVIMPKHNSASITAAVNKVASGATETIPLVRVTNLVRTIEMLKQSGVWIYGTALETEHSIYTFDFSCSVALIMGSEDKGLRRLTKSNCDGLFSIPMLGAVESLNISVATAVALYEIVRQRKFRAD